MSTETNVKTPKTIPGPLNKMVYAAFTLLGLFFFVAKGSVSDGLMYIGLALVFDPFDQTVTWKLRPFYQKAWLMAHLLLALTLFALMIILPVVK
jgi:hypothetical protein